MTGLVTCYCGLGGPRMDPRFLASVPVRLVLPHSELGCPGRRLRVWEEVGGGALNGGAFEKSNRCQVGSWI